MARLPTSAELLAVLEADGLFEVSSEDLLRFEADLKAIARRMRLSQPDELVEWRGKE